MVKSAFAAVAIACGCAVVAEARVTRIEIAKVERVDPPSSGAQGAIQPYERLSGKFYGELDPADPKNALITDIQFAARNARGSIEYVGTFSLMKPSDVSKASGVLMYSVVNRGNGAPAASAEGHISTVASATEILMRPQPFIGHRCRSEQPVVPAPPRLSERARRGGI